MFSRRQFLENGLKGSALVSLSGAVPSFIGATAQAAEVGQDTVLVVVQLSGGNDGLNTVIPYGDDLYHKARPTLRFKKDEVIRIDDHIGLNPSLSRLQDLLKADRLAIVQGVGYPNPNRSHFRSMDIWHTADRGPRQPTGWLGRSLSSIDITEGGIPAFHIGDSDLPLALQSTSANVPTLHRNKLFSLQLSGVPRDDSQIQSTLKKSDKESRASLIRELTQTNADNPNDLLQFVSRTSLRAYTTIDRLRDVLREHRILQKSSGIHADLDLVARMIKAGFGTRVFYVAMDGFDTHAGQRDTQAHLLDQLATAISDFFKQFKTFGKFHDSNRVLLMTFSEFGRRVRENGSQGTDHGAASNMFLVGPAVKGGSIGEHPSLKPEDLAGGDLRFHTDFRQVYATILDQWLKCDSRRVLGKQFEHVELFKKS